MSLFLVDVMVGRDCASLYVSAQNYGQSFEEGERIAQIRFPRCEIEVISSRLISKLEGVA